MRSWSRAGTWLVVLMVLAFASGGPISVQTASANSLIGTSTACGTYEWDGSLTKGRTDSMVAYYDHTVGCFRYKGFTVIGADRENMASNPKAERDWQTATCEQAGRDAVVGHFKYYREMDIDPSTVKVRCALYSGLD